MSTSVMKMLRLIGVLLGSLRKESDWGFESLFTEVLEEILERDLSWCGLFGAGFISSLDSLKLFLMDEIESLGLSTKADSSQELLPWLEKEPF